MVAVLSCGLATVDVVHTVERTPGPNEKVVASATAVEVGGPALNAAVSAARLGADSTLVTAIGQDGLAGFVRTRLGRFEVSVIDLGEGTQPPVSSVLVTSGTGSRAVVSRNAAGEHRYAAVPALPPATTAVLVDGHHLPLCLEVARLARSAGIAVLLDGGSCKPGLEELFEFVDVAVVSADFTLPGGAELTTLLAAGPRFVARTDGPHPVRWWTADGRSGLVRPPRPPRVVDTLGAGDVLHGAMLAKLGRGVTPLDALEFAVPVATASVADPGAHGWHRAAVP